MKIVTALFLAVVLVSCDNDDSGNSAPVSAVAQIYAIEPISDSTFNMSDVAMGEANLEDLGESVRLPLTMSGLTPNFRHAVHLHMGSCEQPGHHWNQGSSESFCSTLNGDEVWARPKAGDVGNINTDEHGNGTLVVESVLWDLDSQDEKDLSGTVLVVHSGMEDFAQECFEQHTRAHVNPKIACGTIELLQ